MSQTVTPQFRVSYPNVFKARKNELNGKEEYSVVALFKKGENLDALKKVVQEAIEKKWGADKAKWPKGLRMPFRDQGDREKDVDGQTVLPDGYEKGAVYLNLKSTQRPPVVDQKKQDIIDETQFYPGCFARAVVNATAYEVKGNKGVSLWLNAIQKVSDGEPLGGRIRAMDAFEAIDTGESADSMDAFFQP